MDYRIISIGALSHNELWETDTTARSPHATTTLIRSNGKNILVDPALPPQIIIARLQERAGLTPDAITHVFLTNFCPAHRMGLTAFEGAKWLISEMEREAVGRMLVERFANEADKEAKSVLQKEIALLKRCEAAPDRLIDQVDLFPLPGYTPGTCGLLLLHMNSTALIAGDAVATAEHLAKGRVLRDSFDAQQAQERFIEAIEIADVIIPGHDNILLNPTRRPM